MTLMILIKKIVVYIVKKYLRGLIIYKDIKMDDVNSKLTMTTWKI